MVGQSFREYTTYTNSGVKGSTGVRTIKWSFNNIIAWTARVGGVDKSVRLTIDTLFSGIRTDFGPIISRTSCLIPLNELIASCFVDEISGGPVEDETNSFLT